MAVGHPAQVHQVQHTMADAGQHHRACDRVYSAVTDDGERGSCGEAQCGAGWRGQSKGHVIGVEEEEGYGACCRS